jgi:16S rRNA (adenine1518-N6/adenine1519-N6)-dimethyltransferase
MVRAKKHLGQHFLDDKGIAKAIVDLLSDECSTALEIGPGEGVLTEFLLERENLHTHVVDVDDESIEFLHERFPNLKGRIHHADFLKMDLSPFGEQVAVIGNFPYNISSQILFKVYEDRDRVPEVVGMFQKEVAERIASGPGKKSYGILSVLLQAFYDISYELTVPEHVFRPPPKVKSGVIRLKRNTRTSLPVEPKFFKAVVKTAFGMRRKTLRNSVKGLLRGRELPEEFLNERPEQLDVDAFLRLAVFLAEG